MSGNITQSVRAPKSNREVAGQKPTQAYIALLRPWERLLTLTFQPRCRCTSVRKLATARLSTLSSIPELNSKSLSDLLFSERHFTLIHHNGAKHFTVVMVQY